MVNMSCAFYMGLQNRIYLLPFGHFFYLHDNRHDLITCRDINGASKYRSGAC